MAWNILPSLIVWLTPFYSLSGGSLLLPPAPAPTTHSRTPFPVRLWAPRCGGSSPLSPHNGPKEAAIRVQGMDE